MKVPYEKSQTQYYPHMKPADVKIWERFIDKNIAFFETVEYDVPVGSTPDFIQENSADAEAGTRKLYSRKIDVVGHNADGVWIVEIKPSAGTSALGQAVGYALLYKRDAAPKETVRVAVLTDVVGPDMNELAGRQGVRLLVV